MAGLPDGEGARLVARLDVLHGGAPARGAACCGADFVIRVRPRSPLGRSRLTCRGQVLKEAPPAI
jgi:hypothetical protein